MAGVGVSVGVGVGVGVLCVVSVGVVDVTVGVGVGVGCGLLGLGPWACCARGSVEASPHTRAKARGGPPKIRFSEAGQVFFLIRD